MAAATAIVLTAVGTTPALGQTAPAPTINVVTWLAPNVSGSPSYAQWQANAISTLKTGTATAAGSPNTPSYALPQSNITRADMIVTGAPSWKGSADPGATFGASYANELGTRPYFGVIINGNGASYSLAQLGLTMTSNDSVNYFGYSLGTADPIYPFQYGSGLQGVLRGTDGVLFTADDVYVTGGANTQLVDGFIGVGFGASDDPCTGTPYQGQCGTTAGRQAAITDEVTNGIFASADPADPRIAWPTTYAGTYTLGRASGTGTFSISAPVPEPATWGMLILGFGFAGLALRRRGLTAMRAA